MVDLSPVTVAITGASGARYGLRLIEVLIGLKVPVHLMISKAARMVLALEEGIKIPSGTKKIAEWITQNYNAGPNLIQVYSSEDWLSPVASGSGAPNRMVVCPCSTGTLSAIACGSSDNLIERAADVQLKERGQLILMVRESPYSQIHLQNMLTLSQAGAVIMPASPGFYHQPETIEDLIDFMVARILQHLKLPQDLMPTWGYGCASRPADQPE